MPSSRVIRIDDQVWAELQKRARPLEDTPNSVLRRVLGLGEEALDADATDPRVDRLLELVQELVDQVPQMPRERRNYSFLSREGQVVAYIRPQRERLRVEAGMETAQRAGLSGWHRERPGGSLGSPSVRWYLPDDDDDVYRQAASILEKLWRSTPNISG